MMNELVAKITLLIRKDHRYFGSSDDITVHYGLFDKLWIAQVTEKGECVELPRGFAESDPFTTPENALMSLYEVLQGLLDA